MLQLCGLTSSALLPSALYQRRCCSRYVPLLSPPTALRTMPPVLCPCCLRQGEFRQCLLGLLASARPQP